jgi:AraC family transcriptional activator of mtrCDE
MDALSRLLHLHPVRTALDSRCQFVEPWHMELAPEQQGVAPYHLIVQGEAWLEVAGQQSVKLVAGDMLVLPRGNSHRLYANGTNQLLSDMSSPNTPDPSGLINDNAGTVTDILCGQFHFGDSTTNTLVGALPDVVHVRTVGRAELNDRRALIDLLRDETTGSRPGASPRRQTTCRVI